jgi:hypothetical protein
MMTSEHINVERYLSYLDKEMTIMGILSGFCGAALALAIKLLSSKDLPSRLVDIPSYAPVSLSLALLLLLFAALSFYRQRSLLAWYYGQIALEDSAHITNHRLPKWLKNADGWDTWMHYQRGFAFLAGTFGELVLAGLAAHGRGNREGLDVWGGGSFSVVLLVAVLIHKLILEKWPLAEDPYEEFRKAPLSVLSRSSDPEEE